MTREETMSPASKTALKIALAASILERYAPKTTVVALDKNITLDGPHPNALQPAELHLLTNAGFTFDPEMGWCLYTGHGPTGKS